MVSQPAMIQLKRPWLCRQLVASRKIEARDTRFMRGAVLPATIGDVELHDSKIAFLYTAAIFLHLIATA